MPLFKKHHDAPVDSTNYPSVGVNDPNYAGAGYGGPTSTKYPSDANTYAGAPPHPPGVGGPVDSSYGTQSGIRQDHPGAAPVGTAVDGFTGNQASRQYNQPGTGYGDPGYGDTGYGGTDYANQPGTFNTTTSHPVRNEIGRASLGAEAGTGGQGGINTAVGGLAGRERAPTGGTVHNTAAATTTGNMSAKDAKSLEMKGKVQQLAGIVLSSQSMKSKGYAKEQEAAAIRSHQMNVEEAERLEAQARLARERAGQGPYH